MSNTKVRFIGFGERWLGHKLPNEDLLDHIEEQLYILWELEPADRKWKQLFNRFGFALFDYHNSGELMAIQYRYLKVDHSELEVLVTPYKHN